MGAIEAWLRGRDLCAVDGVVMETLFSTKDVHARDRFDYWHEVACRRIPFSRDPPSEKNIERVSQSFARFFAKLHRPFVQCKT